MSVGKTEAANSDGSEAIGMANLRVSGCGIDDQERLHEICYVGEITELAKVIESSKITFTEFAMREFFHNLD